MESIEYYENAIEQGKKQLAYFEKSMYSLKLELERLQQTYDMFLSQLVEDKQALDELHAYALNSEE